MKNTNIENQAIKYLNGAEKIEKFWEQAPHTPGVCPVRDVLDRIGDKWSIFVLLSLGQSEGRKRFTELKKDIPGVSQRMLTVTLRALEGDGLLSRETFAEIPPRVEYELTLLGRDLVRVVQPLVSWANAHSAEILTARARFMESKKEVGVFARPPRLSVLSAQKP